MKNVIFISLFVFFFLSCSSKQKGQSEIVEAEKEVPEFCADSAYYWIDKQCAFGARTLESVAHQQCGEYLIEEFKRLGCEVSTQPATFTRYDGVKQKGYNIIAQTNPPASNHIVICSHWDSRPWCDQDKDPSKWRTPVLAANDGASGVGVMLEIARVIQQNPELDFSVDFICFDAEDMGTAAWDDKGSDDSQTWCLGSQLWAKSLHTPNISFGILLDMVGGMGARFYQEGFSIRYASSLVNRVWKAAENAGYSDVFPTQQGGLITDDHLPMNREAHIPTIDIIAYYPDAEVGFGPTWHTSNDNISNISKETLKAVGQTLLQFLYAEN